MSDSLDAMGRHLMSEVRDASLDQLHAVLDGQMQGADAAHLRRLLDGVPRDAAVCLAAWMADRVLHNLLWADESVEDTGVALTIDSGGGPEKARELSDGLAGELYTEDGWFARFSRYPERWVDASAAPPPET